MDNKEVQNNKIYENYEKNLKLQLESSRKDLDIMLTSIIPNQLTLVKTYLWLNISLIGGLAAIFAATIKTLSLQSCLIWFIFLTFLLTFIACALVVYFALRAIHETRKRSFPQDMSEEMGKIAMDTLEHINGLLIVMRSIRDTIEVNQQTIQTAGHCLKKTLICTSFACAFFVLFAALALYNLLTL